MEKTGEGSTIERVRRELRGVVSQIRDYELEDSVCYPPSSAILIGGGGFTGQTYGPLYEQAGIPVSSIIDITPETDTDVRKKLPNAKYLEITAQNPLEKRLEEALNNFPGAAVFITTPQGAHVSILNQIAPILYERQVPVRIEKPLAISIGELQEFFGIINDPNRRGFLNQIVAGGFTLDKATPELIALGAFPANENLLNTIKPTSPEMPDFKETYGDSEKNKRRFGRLKQVGFHFIEGREDIRDVIGERYDNRTYLAVYPGGGISADLIDHVVDKLVVLGYLTPESKLFSCYVGYTPIGLSETSFPWPIPEKEGLAETEVEVAMKTGDVPLILSWGKRGPQSLDDKRKSSLYFENATLTTTYETNSQGQSNIFTVKTNDGQEHSYYLDANPWVLMLQRFLGVWNNSLKSSRGIYPQALSSLLQEDIFNLWKHEPSIFFTADQRFRVKDKGLTQTHIDRIQRDERVVKDILDKTK